MKMSSGKVGNFPDQLAAVWQKQVSARFSAQLVRFRVQ